MQRIYGSSFAECFWLLQENGQPLNEGVLHAGERLDFFYIKGSRNLPAEKLVAGQVLSKELLTVMAEEVFEKNYKDVITWDYEIHQTKDYFRLQLTGTYKEMPVPVNLRIVPLEDEIARAVKLEMPMLLKPERTISYYSYAPCH